MIFKQWFDSQTKIGYPCFIDYLSAQKGWDAAKSEILKEIESHKKLDRDFIYYRASIEEIKENIEKKI